MLRDYGFINNTIKIGVNTANNETFDNKANPYFVYRASIIDNIH